MIDAFIKIFCESLCDNVVDYLADAGADAVLSYDVSSQLPDLAASLWEKTEQQRPGFWSSIWSWLSATPAHEYAKLVRSAVKPLMKGKPPAAEEFVTRYITQVPAQMRRSLRRPSDPTGMTIPSYLMLRKANDLYSFLPTRVSRFQPGQRPLLGVDLELVELLGAGGFGEVWKARNPYQPSAEPVALKFCLDGDSVKMLRHEAALLDRVHRAGRHPGIVPLKRTYLGADPPCLEYEYVEGGDLTGLIQSWHNAAKKPTAAEVARVVLRIAEAVAFAHSQNPPIVHRDLKPANILLQRGADKKIKVRVTDFGIGGLATGKNLKLSQAHPTRLDLLTRALHGYHTPLYSSPQQVRGDPPDPRDDVFSLGVIWYQVLTGDLTSGAPSGMAWAKSLLVNGVPESQVALLSACLEPKAEIRPSSAAELQGQLRRCLREEEPELAQLAEDAPRNDDVLWAEPIDSSLLAGSNTSKTTRRTVATKTRTNQEIGLDDNQGATHPRPRKLDATPKKTVPFRLGELMKWLRQKPQWFWVAASCFLVLVVGVIVFSLANRRHSMIQGNWHLEGVDGGTGLLSINGATFQYHTQVVAFGNMRQTRSSGAITGNTLDGRVDFCTDYLPAVGTRIRFEIADVSQSRLLLREPTSGGLVRFGR